MFLNIVNFFKDNFNMFLGIGIFFIIVVFFLNCYYNIIFCWFFYYMFSFFVFEFLWVLCGNSWNLKYCIDFLSEVVESLFVKNIFSMDNF